MLAALRAGLALLLLLAVASACGGPRRQTATATPTPSAPTQSLAPFVTTESLAVGLFYDLTFGSPVAVPQEGCPQFEAIRWDEAELTTLDADAHAAVVGRLTATGYRASVAGEANAAFTLLATVSSIGFSICADAQGALDIRGPVRMGWTLFSELDQAVVLQQDMVRSVQGLFYGADAFEEALADAMAGGAVALAADPAFQRALVQTPEEAAAAAAPPPDLAIPNLRPFSGRFSAAAPHLLAATVLIPLANGHGSGVIIAESGLILTNHHVVEAAGRVRVELDDGRTLVARVLIRDAQRDVALLEVRAADLTAAPISLRAPQVGEEVYAVGAPIDESLSGTVTKGIVSAWRILDGQRVIQADVVIQGGNSGGPLTDASGNVVGLTVSGIGEESMGINFFIPIAEALAAVGVTLR